MQLQPAVNEIKKRLTKETQQTFLKNVKKEKYFNLEKNSITTTITHKQTKEKQSKSGKDGP